MRVVAPPDWAIEVQSVSKAFRIPSVRRQTIREHALDLFRRRPAERLSVLDDVSLTVSQGESVALMGRNGSGKSTLLRIIAGIFAADSGCVRVSGPLTPILELGVGFNPELDAIDNVFLLGTVMGLSVSEVRARLEEILAFAELERFARLKVQHFSSGMTARLAYAVAFSAVSEILLLDEIFAVGDAAFKTRCEERYRQLVDAGHTVLMVSHDPYIVAELCDRAILLDQGRVVVDGPAAHVADVYLKMLAGADAVSVAFESRLEAGPEQPVERRCALVPAGAQPAIRSRLACPECGHGIDLRAASASCARCGYTREQPPTGQIDLRPASRPDEDWVRRQGMMEAWYARLTADPREARRSFRYDYEGLAPLLATVHGSVLDVGGGLGVARQYLPHRHGEYVIVEPSAFWLELDWTPLRPDFPVLRQPVDFIQGHGEHLPLRNASFDCALALWSLNHAIDPARVVTEVHRVLREDGRFVIVLDDVAPVDAAAQPPAALLESEQDHVRIHEGEFLSWLDGRFEIAERRSTGHYLLFDLRRVGAANNPDARLAERARVEAGYDEPHHRRAAAIEIARAGN
jgi:ABC-type polysaccharide/polyol phosphate transport system ATPase subunit/SAM-dependent methyltransferase